MIALGTHQGMSEEQLVGTSASPGRVEAVYPGWTIINHESWRPETFISLGRSVPTGSPN